jgi:hypothetical protein
MNEFQQFMMEEAIEYNIKKGKPLTECIYRRESDAFVEYFKYLKENQDKYTLTDFDKELLSTDIGEKAMYEGEEVWLDLPFMEAIEKMDDDPCQPGWVMLGTKMKNGKKVPNCVPEDSLTEEEKVELNKPKRGGPKKFYVYVKNDKGNVVKVTFGDTTGLSVKFDDDEARKSFVARHDCANKKDKTKPGYWSCNLPKYASQLGLSNGGNFYW